MTTATNNGRLAGIEITPKTASPKRTKAPVKATKTASPRRRKLRLQIAAGVGIVGVGVLSLSVVHCTEAIQLLTGSHWTLSGLLAIGIDAGMVACELAELVTDDRAVRRWSTVYVIAAILLSMLLNAYAFSRHASPGMEWAGIVLGVAIPGLVFVLGRVAGLLAR